METPGQEAGLLNIASLVELSFWELNEWKPTVPMATLMILTGRTLFLGVK